jgi:hypothetical protein
MGGFSNALEELRLADHMIYVTLPLLDDKQIFLNAVSHLGNAVRDIVRTFMKFEAAYKRINFLPSEDLLINEFIMSYSERLGVESFIQMIKDVTSFNNVRKRSSIKLKRNDKFIVISPEYSMVALSMKQVKEYLGLAREFIQKMRGLINEG